MKIICNKKEFAEIVRSCYKNTGCYNCALNGVCDGQDSIVAFADVVEEGEDDDESKTAYRG